MFRMRVFCNKNDTEKLWNKIITTILTEVNYNYSFKEMLQDFQVII